MTLEIVSFLASRILIQTRATTSVHRFTASCHYYTIDSRVAIAAELISCSYSVWTGHGRETIKL